MIKLYVDMDGVLADFDRHYEDVFGVCPSKVADNVDWKAIRNTPNFYLNIPPMKDMPILWDYIKGYAPTIITGIPKSVAEAASNKVSWVRKNLGNVPVICCLSKDKCMYANPGDILIDDWEKYRKKWEDCGGVWITHRSALQTIHRLKQMGY